MRGARWLAAVLVLTVLLAGCDDKKQTAGSGASGSASGSGSGSGSGATSTTAKDDHDHAPPTLVDPQTGKQGKIGENDRYTASAPPPVEYRKPDISGRGGAAPPGAVPLEARVTPPCVEHGQQVTVVLKSEPGITLAAQIKWPNEAFSDLDQTRGAAGPDGTLSWTVEIKPTALYGQADLMAAAIDEQKSGREGSSGDWFFVVAPPGRC
jgi:hypothetical protein